MRFAMLLACCTTLILFIHTSAAAQAEQVETVNTAAPDPAPADDAAAAADQAERDASIAALMEQAGDANKATQARAAELLAAMAPYSMPALIEAVSQGVDAALGAVTALRSVVMLPLELELKFREEASTALFGGQYERAAVLASVAGYSMHSEGSDLCIAGMRLQLLGRLRDAAQAYEEAAGFFKGSPMRPPLVHDAIEALQIEPAEQIGNDPLQFAGPRVRDEDRQAQRGGVYSSLIALAAMIHLHELDDPATAERLLVEAVEARPTSTLVTLLVDLQAQLGRWDDLPGSIEHRASRLSDKAAMPEIDLGRLLPALQQMNPELVAAYLPVLMIDEDESELTFVPGDRAG